jgi:hypothetical protein
MHFPLRLPRGLAHAIAALFLLVLAGCDSVPLTAPTRSTISLYASASQVSLNGTLDITATIIEPSGTTVQNGTVVTFTTTLGRIEPSEARTNGGKVTVKFYSGTVSGIAEIGAFSGGASTSGGTTSGGGGGTGTTPPTTSTSGTGPLKIKVGGAAATKLALSASPTVLPSSGGTARLVALVTDDSGNQLEQVSVTFVTTAGTLASSVVNTDSNGEARVDLNTNRDAEVTARAGAAEGKVTVKLGTTLTLGITPPAAIQSTIPANFTFSVGAPAAGSPSVRDVIVQWGDGTSTSLGALTGSATVSHTFSLDGNYSVTLAATDSTGERFSTSTSVVVNPVQVSITLSAPSEVVVNRTFTVTVTVIPSNTRVRQYIFETGERTLSFDVSATTFAPEIFYSTLGSKLLKVTAITDAGTRYSAQTSINVVPTP